MYDDNCDVAICGGGLAGLTFALQLKREQKDLDVAVLDSQKGPLPQAAHKVGESTVDLAAWYLGKTLGLEDYLQRKHLPKKGLRYFFGGGDKPLPKRPEMGLSKFSPLTSYQLDRGILENDLRSLIQDEGIRFIEGATVRDVDVSDSNTTVQYLDASSRAKTLSTKWVADAMGQRRFLQRKLGYEIDSTEVYSAVWLRVDDKIDISSLVEESEQSWHNRDPEGERSLSTNHLMGNGYWIWFIPLSSGATSIGLVTDERFHPFSTFYSKKLFRKWLAQNEPEVARLLQERRFMDFKRRYNYSYSSQKVFGPQWFCLGESAVFPDPFYSPGSDLIALSNTIACEMIRRNRNGRLADEHLAFFNDYFISYALLAQHNIQAGYGFMGEPLPATAKILWDISVGWTYNFTTFKNRTIRDIDAFNELQPFFQEQSRRAHLMLNLFKDWSELTQRRYRFEFIDYMELEPIGEIYSAIFQDLTSPDRRREFFYEASKRIIALGKALAALAISDCYPEYDNVSPSEISLEDLDLKNPQTGISTRSASDDQTLGDRYLGDFAKVVRKA